MGRARPGPAPAGPHAGPHPRLLPPKGGESSRHGRTPPHAPSPAQDLACRVQTGVEQRRRGQDVQTAGARGAALAEPGWGRRRGGHAAPSQNWTPSWWPAAARPQAPTQPAAEGSQQRQWPADRPAASVPAAWALGRLSRPAPAAGWAQQEDAPPPYPASALSPTVFCLSLSACSPTLFSPTVNFFDVFTQGGVPSSKGLGCRATEPGKGGGGALRMAGRWTGGRVRRRPAAVGRGADSTHAPFMEWAGTRDGCGIC